MALAIMGDRARGHPCICTNHRALAPAARALSFREGVGTRGPNPASAVSPLPCMLFICVSICLSSHSLLRPPTCLSTHPSIRARTQPPSQLPFSLPVDRLVSKDGQTTGRCRHILLGSISVLPGPAHLTSPWSLGRAWWWSGKECPGSCLLGRPCFPWCLWAGHIQPLAPSLNQKYIPKRAGNCTFAR